MAYKKPILCEVLVEAHLGAHSLPQSAFFDVVPELKKSGFTDIEMGEAGFRLEFDPEQSEPRPRPKPRIRCWRADRTALIQLSEDLLVSNLTGDYPGWKHVRDLFETATAALNGAVPNAVYESLNLSTIDRFTAPLNGFRLGDYLDCGGRYVPAWYQDATDPLDLSLGRGFLKQQGYNRSIKVKVRIADDEVRMEIHGVFHDRLKAGANMFDTLDALHTESNAAFEALITERTRNEVMEGAL